MASTIFNTFCAHRLYLQIAEEKVRGGHHRDFIALYILIYRLYRLCCVCACTSRLHFYIYYLSLYISSSHLFTQI